MQGRVSIELLSNELQIDPAGNRGWMRELLPEMGSSFALIMNDNPKVTQCLTHAINYGDKSSRHRSSLSLSRIKEDRKKKKKSESLWKNPLVACTRAWLLSQHQTHLCISQTSSKRGKLNWPRAKGSRIHLTLDQASSVTATNVLWAAFQSTLHFEGE